MAPDNTDIYLLWLRPLTHLHMFALQMHLALYCFANGQLSTALKLLYRARYLLLLVSGEDHPEMALLDVSAVFTLCVNPADRRNKCCTVLWIQFR